MILSDKTIADLLRAGDLKVTPEPGDAQLQPVSIDLRLGNSWVQEVADVEEGYRYISDYRSLRPGEFVLGCTLERLTLPRHIVGFVAGKSTWARRGLQVEAAGLVDPGFTGTITLELKNMSHHTLALSAGEAICQVYFMPTDLAVARPYGSPGLNSHYQGQVRAEPARG